MTSLYGHWLVLSLWMLEGPQAFFEATVGAPCLDLPIWTPREDMPLIKAQAQHCTLVTTDLLYQEESIQYFIFFFYTTARIHSSIFRSHFQNFFTQWAQQHLCGVNCGSFTIALGQNAFNSYFFQITNYLFTQTQTLPELCVPTSWTICTYILFS